MRRFRLFYRVPDQEKVEDEMRHAVINAKNRQIKALQKVVSDLADQLEWATGEMNKGKGSDVENRLLDLAEGFLLEPKTKEVAGEIIETQKVIKPDPDLLPDEKGSYSEEQITTQLKRIPKGMLKRAVDSGEEKFSKRLRNFIPGIKKADQIKSFELAKAMV